MLRISNTQIRRTVRDRDLSNEVIKLAEYVFRTHYGHFPRSEDFDTFIPLVRTTLEEWKVFYKGELSLLHKKFFHDTLSMVIDHVKGKEGPVESV